MEDWNDGMMEKKNTAGFVRPRRTMPCHGKTAGVAFGFRLRLDYAGTPAFAVGYGEARDAGLGKTEGKRQNPSRKHENWKRRKRHVSRSLIRLAGLARGTEDKEELPTGLTRRRSASYGGAGRIYRIFAQWAMRIAEH